MKKGMFWVGSIYPDLLIYLGPQGKDEKLKKPGIIYMNIFSWTEIAIYVMFGYE